MSKYAKQTVHLKIIYVICTAREVKRILTIYTSGPPGQPAVQALVVPCMYTFYVQNYSLK